MCYESHVCEEGTSSHNGVKGSLAAMEGFLPWKVGRATRINTPQELPSNVTDGVGIETPSKLTPCGIYSEVSGLLWLSEFPPHTIDSSGPQR